MRYLSTAPSIIFAMVLISSGLAAQDIPVTEDPATHSTILLKTRWKQRDAYARFTPVNPSTGKHERLGCWSVALAQILYYHKLAPTGSASFISGSHPVTANFIAEPVRMDRIALTLKGVPADSETAIETARYLWYASLVTGKKFGTGGYMGNTDVRRAKLEQHYPVKTSRVKYPGSTREQVEEFIRHEIAAQRPLLLYMEGSGEGEEGTAHAMVIDGVEGTKDALRVHINFGWEGTSDGWYDFWNPVTSAYGTFNRPERWVMSVIPR